MARAADEPSFRGKGDEVALRLWRGKRGVAIFRQHWLGTTISPKKQRALAYTRGTAKARFPITQLGNCTRQSGAFAKEIVGELTSSCAKGKE